MDGAAMRCRAEGVKGDSWCCYALEKGGEMECLGCYALEGGGRKGDAWCCYALEEGGEMECFCCHALQGGGRKRGFMMLMP